MTRAKDISKIVSDANFGGTLDVGGAFTSLGIDDNANATAITIDSSENVLVGKTNQTANVAGTEIEGSGTIVSTRASNTNLFLNRTGSDGELINFRKDNTVVGSIGNAGARLFINSGTVGLNFAGDGSDQILPSNAGANRDNAITLGTTNVRFKDIYLSGGAFLGGTGTANKLDDYEEGAHTITFTNISANPSSQGSNYTKIGNVVNYMGSVEFPSTSDTNSVNISLPFVSAARNGIGVFLSNGSTNKILFTGGDGTNYMRVYSDNSFTQNTYNQFSTQTFYFTITYQTTA